MQDDADDQQNHAKRDECGERFHLKFPDALHALVDFAMKKHNAKA